MLKRTEVKKSSQNLPRPKIDRTCKYLHLQISAKCGTNQDAEAAVQTCSWEKVF